MCILASTIGCNAMRQFKVYVDVCLNVGVKPREIREVIYQTVPYVGFSKGSRIAAEFDVTDKLREGENFLAVKVLKGFSTLRAVRTS